PEGLPAEADPHLRAPRDGPARRGLPRPAVEDRGRLWDDVGQGVPARHAEPAQLPPRAAHRLHLLRVRRGVGFRGRARVDRALPRARAARDRDRYPRARPLRRAPRARADRHRLLAGGHQRGHDHRPPPRRRHPPPVLQLRRLLPPLPPRRRRPHHERLDAPLLLLRGEGWGERAARAAPPLATGARPRYATTELIALTSCAFGTAPTICSLTCPLWKTIRFGMPRTP